MKKFVIVAVIVVAVLAFLFLRNGEESFELVEYEIHPLVEAARAQIGVVTSYGTGYYAGGYPPEDSGACADVVVRSFLG